MTTIEIVLAILGSNVITAVISALLNRSKIKTDSDHTAVETAGDVLEMAQATYRDRVASVEENVKSLKVSIVALNLEITNLKKERSTLDTSYSKDIKELSARLGAAMSGAEALSKEVKVLLLRVDELSNFITDAGGKLPEWIKAKGNGGTVK